jgi:hypothetical protein
MDDETFGYIDFNSAIDELSGNPGAPASPSRYLGPHFGRSSSSDLSSLFHWSRRAYPFLPMDTAGETDTSSHPAR